MEMTFKNALGAIRMDGGSGDAPFKILKAEGLGYLGQNALTVAYPFTAGQKTLSRSPGARLVTVSAEAAEGGVNYEGAVAAIAHDSGRLEIVHGEKRVYAQCYISALDVTRAKGGDYEKYVFQFTCDYPYFRDMTPTAAPLFQRKKRLRAGFSLPAVFSEREVGAAVTVGGDRDVYPVICVRGLSGEDDIPLELENTVTGARLKLTLPAGEYGLITFDLWNGRIYCGDRDLSRYLTEDSYMSDFYLARGENRIEVKAMEVSVNTAASVSCECEYYSAWEDRNV